MGYPAELLSDGEIIEFEMRPHWRSLLRPIVVTVAVLAALGFIGATWTTWFDGSQTVQAMGRWVFLGIGLLLVGLYALRPFLYWFATQYVFTDRRIIIRRGLIAREGRDVPLSKVNNVSFRVSVWGRVLNYGTLTIDSASDEELVIDDVPNVEMIQREINRLHEADDYRRRAEAAEA